MKKKLVFVLSMLLILLVLASAAAARPNVNEFRSDDYDLSQVKTVLVMPVFYDVSVPP